MKILFGMWRNDPNGLKPCQIQNRKVFINETDKRIVHSPATALGENGIITDEVVAEPGQVICYLDQDEKNTESGKGTWVVVGYEIEIARWIDRYFYHPTKAPGLVDVNDFGITIMDVPVSHAVLNSYPYDVKVELRRILKNKDLSSSQRRIVDTMLIISLI